MGGILTDAGRGDSPAQQCIRPTRTIGGPHGTAPMAAPQPITANEPVLTTATGTAAAATSGFAGLKGRQRAGVAQERRHRGLLRRSGSLARPGLASLLLVLSLSAPAWAGVRATRVEVLLQGMDCSLCSEGLERRLRSLPGAEAVQLELERGRLSLTLRPGSTVADETLRELMRNAGFVVRQIRRSSTAP